MRILSLGALALVSAITAFITAAPAQARWAPSGSYEASCRRVEFDGDVLTATCRTRDGGWRNTYLDNADDCGGNIVNNNGQLECGWSDWRGRRWAGRHEGPGGSYTATCTNIRMDGYTLKATCQRRDGSWRWSSLDYAYDCDGRIANFDGRLTCARGRGRW